MIVLEIRVPVPLVPGTRYQGTRTNYTRVVRVRVSRNQSESNQLVKQQSNTTKAIQKKRMAGRKRPRDKHKNRYNASQIEKKHVRDAEEIEELEQRVMSEVSIDIGRILYLEHTNLELLAPKNKVPTTTTTIRCLPLDR